jgi:tetratricopeptide (TPR) repeat protein
MDILRAFPGTAVGSRQGILLSGVALACVLLLALAGRAWWNSYQSRGLTQLELATLRVRGAQGPQTSAGTRAEAIKALQSLIERYPRLTALPQAAHQLGNLHYQAKAFDEARKAHQLCLSKGARGSLAALCRLGIGYTWEAQGDHAHALAAFEGALQGLTPQDFLYEELRMDVARSYELLGQPARARGVYTGLLKDLPESRRGEEIRAHLARLEGRPPRR